MPYVKWVLFNDDDESVRTNYTNSSSTAVSSMSNYIFGVVSFLVLEFLWKIQLTVEKFFNSNKNRLTTPPLEKSTQSIPPDIKQNQPKLGKKRKKKGLFFNPESGRRRSYLSLKDLISPAEEEMLMLLCAKRSSPEDKSNEKTYEECLDLLSPEHQIPRSKFTAIWIESCGIE